EPALARADLADHDARLKGRALVGHGLEVLADPEPARVPGRAPCREDVVRSDRLVAVRDRRRLAEEEGAVVAQSREVPVRVARVHLYVFKGELVCLATRLLVVADDANLAVVAPRYRRDVRGREALELVGDLALDVVGELPGRGHQDRGRGRPVLRLAKQVGRDELRVGGFVRDDQDLGRAGEKVDPDATEQLPLCFDYVSVAGPSDEVDRLDRPSAKRKRRDRVNPAKA